jgi:hypothetical protein
MLRRKRLSWHLPPRHCVAIFSPLHFLLISFNGKHFFSFLLKEKKMKADGEADIGKVFAVQKKKKRNGVE